MPPRLSPWPGHDESDGAWTGAPNGLGANRTTPHRKASRSLYATPAGSELGSVFVVAFSQLPFVRQSRELAATNGRYSKALVLCHQIEIFKRAYWIELFC